MFKKSLISIVFIVFYFLFSGPVLAAKLYFNIPDEIKMGRIFSVQLMISPEESINAVGGKIKFDPNLLEYKDFSDANSLINLWVEKPFLIGKDIISFSGIIPGGIGPVNSRESKLINLFFLSKKTGQGLLTLGNLKVYLHQDGAQEVFSAGETATINILEANDMKNDKTLLLDFYPPEEFEIFIAKDTNLFHGSRVVIFEAQDKGSGIDHYEVREKTLGLFGEWHVADSPYVLQHIYPASIIEVKAVDKVGLERTERFIPQGFIYFFVGILIFSLVLIIILFLKIFMKIFKN